MIHRQLAHLKCFLVSTALFGAIFSFSGPVGAVEALKDPVFQSVSWQLPNEAFLSVAVHPLQGETALVGGETGIYRTADGGRTWERVLFLGAKVADDGSFFQTADGLNAPGPNVTANPSNDAWMDEDIIEEFDDLIANNVTDNVEEEMPEGDVGGLQSPQNNALPLMNPPIMGVNQLVWPRSAPNLVLAATHMGLYRSNNGGLSFERVELGETVPNAAVLNVSVLELAPARSGPFARSGAALRRGRKSCDADSRCQSRHPVHGPFRCRCLNPGLGEKHDRHLRIGRVSGPAARDHWAKRASGHERGHRGQPHGVRR